MDGASHRGSGRLDESSDCDALFEFENCQPGLPSAKFLVSVQTGTLALLVCHQPTLHIGFGPQTIIPDYAHIPKRRPGMADLEHTSISGIFD